ncbi:MAG TPA: copper transporter, partial [Micromonosporaceae bacterium]|nr:copper transporter [Micromonosporaceae bacterium]
GPDRSATLARFAAQVDRSGAGAVLTGPVGTAGGSGAVGLARADTSVAQILSTVDNVNTPAGRIVTLLALREQLDERSGRYGVAGNAQALAPGLTTG